MLTQMQALLHAQIVMQQTELNRQLQNQLSQLRDEHQNTIQSLRDAHVLMERQAESCAKLAASEVCVRGPRVCV